MTYESAGDILEHFGTKGMKWGVRNNRTSGGKSKPKLTAQQRQARSERRMRIASNVVLGIAVAGTILNAVGSTMVGDVPPRSSSSGSYQRSSGSTGSGSSRSRPKSPVDLINQERDTQMASMTRMHAEGRMDDAQFQNFSRTLNARYDRRVREAGG
jgi:hypothetical protein